MAGPFPGPPVPHAPSLSALSVELLLQVSSLMGDEIGTVAEALAALPAAVRLLLLVRPLVSDQVGAPTEAFPTLRALERFPEGAVGLEVLEF